MAREFLLFVQESAYKTPVTPTVGATGTLWNTTSSATAFNAFYGRLDGGDSFTMRARATPVTVPYGGGFAIPAFTVSDKLVVEGKYTTKLYAGPFTQFLLQWGAQQVNTLGYVAPAGISTGWATTEIAGNLASVSIYHAIQLSTGAYKCRRYSGVKVKSWNLEISQDSQIGTLSLDLTGAVAQGNQWDTSTDPTLTAAGTAPTYTAGPPAGSTFAPPATNNLPINPYLFINASNTGGSGSAGFLDIGSGALTARTTFQSVGLSCTNKLMTRFWANRFVQFSQFCGRDLKLTAQNFYSNSPDDRTAFEGLTAQSISFAIGNGTHSATFVMNTNNILTSIEDHLPLDDVYTQTLTATSQYDPAYSSSDSALAADFQMAFT